MEVRSKKLVELEEGEEMVDESAVLDAYKNFDNDDMDSLGLGSDTGGLDKLGVEEDSLGLNSDGADGGGGGVVGAGASGG